MIYEQMDINDLVNELNKKKNINQFMNSLILNAKKNQAYDSDSAKDYIIFRICKNKQIDYFVDLGQGYTSELEEAGLFNEVGVKYFNAFLVKDIEEALKDKKHDYYAIHKSYFE